MAECMAARPLPGEGEVDLGHLLGVLDDIGAVPMVCPEPFNPSMVADVGVDEAARLMVEATRAVLARS
jgi:sugar phosphate isomerase/epimerase